MLTQTGLDSRAPLMVLVLRERCQFLGCNPSSLNSRLGFWALVTWAWCGLGPGSRGERLGVQLKSGELCTQLGCGELEGRGPGVKQTAGRGWELPCCTGSTAAKDRAGRRLTLVLFSSDDMWLGKAGLPGEEGDCLWAQPSQLRSAEWPMSSGRPAGTVHSPPGSVPFPSSLHSPGT